ncbi:molecular chaperone [Shewanella waksmanii]|uniref:TorD/DmsD family molecular chaperone n=1 Tax=Shewanella waksmanii TaxID=213783 RepID=UPI0037364E9F
MMSSENNSIVAAKFNWLANVFYQVPTEVSLQLIAENIDQWPINSEASRGLIHQLKQSCQTEGIDTIKQDFHRLFIGPGKKLVYPWGSVYTDEEKLLFGRTTIAWEQFCRQHQIDIKPDSNEPTDHFGLFFAAISAVFTSELESMEKSALVQQMLDEHFSPWGHKVLADINQLANTVFFKCFAQLALEELKPLAQVSVETPSVLH